MTSPLCVATGGWCRRVFHYRPPTPMYRNSPPLCTIVLQIPSLMPLKMRKVQLGGGAPGLVAPGISLHGVQVNPDPNVIMHVVSPQMESYLSTIVPSTLPLRRVSECDFKAKCRLIIKLSANQ